jgi:hypothetical protein
MVILKGKAKVKVTKMNGKDYVPIAEPPEYCNYETTSNATCTLLFAACNYKICLAKLCASSAKFTLPDNEPIKSVWVPKDVIATLHDKENYGGEKTTFSVSNPCIATKKMFLSLKMKTSHLKSNKKN